MATNVNLCNSANCLLTKQTLKKTGRMGEKVFKNFTSEIRRHQSVRQNKIEGSRYGMFGFNVLDPVLLWQ